MRKLATSTFVTLDGVMQAPGGPEEDPTGAFAYGGWSVNYWDDMMGQIMGEALARPFDLRLRDSKTSTTGVVIATYEPAGDVPVGSFAIEQPTPAELARRQRWAQEE
jgi:hypothetical protein